MFLTLRAALAKFLAEVLSGDAGTGGVAGLPRVITWLVIIHVIGRTICKGDGTDAERSNGTFSNSLNLSFLSVNTCFNRLIYLPGLFLCGQE